MGASNFQGWLLRNADTHELFPHRFINKDSYEIIPDQRTELKAYRDNNIYLHRIVSPNHKTKIEFSTIDKLRLSQLETILQWINGATINAKERKVRFEYWNDALQQYRTMNAAYQTDTTYPISTISSSNIKYRSIKFTFIEY